VSDKSEKELNPDFFDYFTSNLNPKLMIDPMLLAIFEY